MKYPPGSFTKNFAWHGRGLAKLYSSIRSGFHVGLNPVYREDWRRDSGINDSSLDLIPINFFLHNKQGALSVDELVFQSVRHDHSLAFDHLALFAFHLSQVGDPPRGVSRPALWANEFVREILWTNDTWQKSALDKNILDQVLSEKIEADDGVKVKCRTNYRHLFELCGYLVSPLPFINSRVNDWIASALFLFWDRQILDAGPLSRNNLLELVVYNEIYKLAGISENEVVSHAKRLVDLYIEAGAIGRFATNHQQMLNFSSHPLVTSSSYPVVASPLDLLEQNATDEAVERRAIEVNAQIRNRKISTALKKHYDNRCMICGIQLRISEDEYYSEAAHIKPLGLPHNGPDHTINMLILCPNHHLQFDRGVLTLRLGMGGYIINSLIPNDPLHNRVLFLRHDLDSGFVEWHANWFKWQ